MPSPRFDAVLMLGSEGPGPAEQLVEGARKAAAHDLVHDLVTIPEIGIVHFATSEEAWARASGLPVRWELDDGTAFHFGRRLTRLIQENRIRTLVYMGAGSAPLLSREVLQAQIQRVAAADRPTAVTNNLHSSDWIVLNHADQLIPLAERLPNDNALGWVLRTEANFAVSALPASAATRMDLDTPADFAPLVFHPAIKAHLRDHLRGAELNLSRYRAAAGWLFRPGSEVALIGRVSSAAWSYVEQHTQVWIRVFSEERGMSASGRLAAGKVRSLLAEYVDRVGIEGLFMALAELANSAFFDNRVLLAHRRAWPSPADRYASDLGRPEWVADDFLRRLTEASLQAELPVVMGGHGVVAGGLYALVEAVQAGTLNVGRES